MNVMNIFHEDKTQFVALTRLTTFRRAPGWFLRKIFALFLLKRIAFILFFFLARLMCPKPVPATFVTPVTITVPLFSDW